MGQIYDCLDKKTIGWIERQPMFFVATAPLAADGHVNVSPKGIRGTFAVLGPRSVAWLDFAGSGIETAAHLCQYTPIRTQPSSRACRGISSREERSDDVPFVRGNDEIPRLRKLGMTG